MSISEIGRNVLESTQEEEDESYDGRDVIAVMADAPISLDAPAMLPASFDLFASLSTFDLHPPEIRSVPPWQGQWSWPPPTARQRHALLQVFLF